MNYDYSTSTFQHNTAQYGGDLASVPTSLRLRIYYVEPFFLYLDSVTTKDLLSSSSTVKLFLFEYISSSSLEIDIWLDHYRGCQVSRSHIWILSEFIIRSLDYWCLWKPGWPCKLCVYFFFTSFIKVVRQGEFKIKSYSSSSSSSSSNLVGMLGNGKFTYTDCKNPSHWPSSLTFFSYCLRIQRFQRQGSFWYYPDALHWRILSFPVFQYLWIPSFAFLLCYSW